MDIMILLTFKFTVWGRYLSYLPYGVKSYISKTETIDGNSTQFRYPVLQRPQPQSRGLLDMQIRVPSGHALEQPLTAR